MNFGRFVRIDELPNKDALRQFFQNKSGQLERAGRQLFSVLSAANCHTVVSEDEYIDSDFRDSHKRFYYLQHKDTARRCTRLHFFSKRITRRDLVYLKPATASSYLGYTVIRPLPAHHLGSSIFNCQLASSLVNTLYPSESAYISCHSPQRVNLVGNEIAFDGIPWMQQDRLVAACASVAIWTANRHLSSKFPRDFRRFTSAAITDLAVRYNLSTGRGMPSDGLTVDQMVLALKSMEYEPLYEEPEDAYDAANILYRYLKSSIPVIIVMTYPTRQGGHAVTAVGYSLNSKLPTQYRSSYKSHSGKNGQADISDISDYIGRFFIQDDSGGPLRFLELLDWNKAEEEKLVTPDLRKQREGVFPCVLRIQSQNGTTEVAYLESLLVPLPLRVTLKGFQAQRNSIDVVRNLVQLKQNDPLVFSTSLLPSNIYKEWWSPQSGRAANFGLLIRRQPLPYWLWITEYASKTELAKSGRVLGHVIQDCSGRGIGPHLDDLLALVTPEALTLAMPKGTFASTPGNGTIDLPAFDR